MAAVSEVAKKVWTEAELQALPEDGFIHEVVDGELKRREVETSVSNLTRIEITRGLKDQAQVALGSDSVETLRDGMPVRVVQR